MSTSKNVLVDVWLVSLLATRLVEERLAESPLSVDEFALYGLISDLGPVTATQLTRWTGLPATTLSAMVRRCESRGELRRAANPDDRRSTLLKLTARGTRAYQRSLPALADALSRVRAGLAQPEGDVRQALQTLDTALRAALGAEPRPYDVEESRGSVRGHSLRYEGAALTEAQRIEATGYLAWIRHRDG